jgi:hypothetical protein
MQRAAAQARPAGFEPVVSRLEIYRKALIIAEKTGFFKGVDTKFDTRLLEAVVRLLKGQL